MTARRRHTLAGWSLVELLVGLALGLMVATAGTAAVYALHAAYAMVADGIRLEQRGQQALDHVSALLRHAGWRPVASPASMPVSTAPIEPVPLAGSDDCGQPAVANPPRCGKGAVGASDAILVRFGGVDATGNFDAGDHHVADCSGYPLAPRGERHARAGAVNLLYVANAADGEPQLLCRYLGRGGGWSSGALVRGVETLQLRYGIDADGDGRVDQFLRASELTATGSDNWRRVRAVQVAMVLRGERRHDSPRAAAGPAPPLSLLPARWPGDSGDDIAYVPATRPGATRRVFATTVWLRNAPFCDAAPC